MLLPLTSAFKRGNVTLNPGEPEATLRQRILATEPAVFLPMTETDGTTLADISGHDRHGTATSNVSGWTDYTVGPLGNALKFGSGRGVNMLTAPGTDFASCCDWDEYSIMYFMRLPASEWEGAIARVVLYLASANTDGGINRQYLPGRSLGTASDGALWRIYADGEATPLKTHFLTTDKWLQSILIISQSTNTIKWYVGGQQVLSTEAVSNTWSVMNLTTALMGALNTTGTSAFWTGWIQGVALWNKALSSAERGSLLWSGDGHRPYPDLIVRDGKHSRAPNVLKLANNSYLMVYQYGEAEDTTTEIFLRASANGEIWGDIFGATTETPDFNMKGANIIQKNNGDLLMVYNRVTPDPVVTRVGIFYRTSSDNGQTWSAANEIETSYSDAAIGGPPIRLASGDILQPCWASKVGNIETFFMRSTNDGAAWGGEVLGATGGLFYEPCIVQMDNGHILCLMRDQTSASQATAITSEDGGATWGPPALAFSDAQSALRLIQLSDNRIISAYRQAAGAGITLIRTSADRGATWSAPLNVLRDNHNCTYCGLVELPAGRVGVAYGVKWDFYDAAIHYKIYAFEDLP